MHYEETKHLDRMKAKATEIKINYDRKINMSDNKKNVYVFLLNLPMSIMWGLSLHIFTSALSGNYPITWQQVESFTSRLTSSIRMGKFLSQ